MFLKRVFSFILILFFFIINYSISWSVNRELKIKIGSNSSQITVTGKFLGRYKVWKFVKSGNRLSIKGQRKQYSKIILKSSGNKTVKYRNIKYRGILELFIRKNRILVINTLRLEEYLQGVVPREIGSNSPFEAQKAQAIIARSYALSMINKYVKDGYNLTNSTDCQVYGGKSSETKKTNKAVQATRGYVLFSKNKIFTPYYHASCGGQTATPVEAWTGAKTSSNFYSIPCSGCRNRNYFWKAEIPEEKFLRLLKKSGYSLKQISDIKVLRKSNSGRISALMIFGIKETIILSGHLLRRILGATIVKSTMFDIKIINMGKNKKSKNSDIIGNIIRAHNIKDVIRNRLLQKRRKTGKIIELKGKGYGHGVGLCQKGAIYYSSLGQGFRSILKRYFKGIKIKKL